MLMIMVFSNLKTFSFNRRNHHEKENYLYILILIGLQTYLKNAFADEFDTSLLVGESAKGDISRFYSDGQIPAGKQLVDLMLIRFGKDNLTSMLRIMVSRSALHKVMSLSSV